MMKHKSKNNPTGRIEKFLREHEKETDDYGGTFSSSMQAYTVAPFIVKYLDQINKLAIPLDSDTDGYV